MDLDLNSTSKLQLTGLPASLLLDYYNMLAKEVDLPTRDTLEPAHNLARRITTLRGVRMAQGMDRQTPPNHIVCLSDDPARGLVVGKRSPSGCAPNFNRYPKDKVTRPDHGLRLKALELLETGATPDDIEFLVIKEGDPKAKAHTRYRALELLRVLNNRDGWGLYQDIDGKIYATDRPEDVDLAIDELSVL